MADIKVITDDACNCGCDGGIVGVESPSNSADSIIVRSKPGIAIGNIINAYIENGKKVYELDDFTLQKPQISFSQDAAITEVGKTVTLATYNGNISAGSYPIASRSISPDPGGLNLNAPFSFTKSNVKRTTPGLGQPITVQATDDHANVTTVIAGVPFKDAYYQGFSSLAVLDQAGIKSLPKFLADNILAQFAGARNYVVPASPSGPKYIYFCGVLGSQVPTGAILNGLPLPLSTLTPVAVTNIFDGTLVIQYWVMRTAERLDPGTYSITLY